MIRNTLNDTLNNFMVAGINYRKSDINLRGRFSISTTQSGLLIEEAVSKKIPGCLVLSTCNRTELYGICNDPRLLTEMICTHSQGNMKDFRIHGYVYHGLPAIEHLFKVASGLDSQITGDYEILSQLKQATRISKQYHGMNNLMERIINYALQASKEIKTKTKLSSGTVSVSYAAIRIIKEKINDLGNKKILLVGTGKFGNQIAKNLKDYLPGSCILFANRTDEKAYSLAEQYDAGFVSFRNLPAACNDADIIIVSSSSGSYMVIPSFFVSQKSRLVLDLSSPQNVDSAIKDLPGITLLDVDEVSLIADETILSRQAEIPKALQIIHETIHILLDWHHQQLNTPLLIQVKSQLYQLNEIYFTENHSIETIHKTVSSLALQLKHSASKGCECITALNGFLQKKDEMSL